MAKPKFGDPDYMPWSDRTLAKLEIKRLQNKIKRLERDLNKCQDQRRAQLKFEYAFRKFYIRLSSRKYISDWPIQRIDEALLYVKELLP